ncbi:Integral membrane channel protein [Madurella fahalii]|uniref:Integral membrane channel protein n=1 Tax=Madurella fahalii TaxID=1157608 RepID=A0ABQ0GMH7_9PEZI
MLSALLRPFQGNNAYNAAAADVERDVTPRPSVGEYREYRHATADFTEADDDEEEEEESNHGEQSRYPLGGRTQDDEDGLAQSAGLLPMFSGGHLDSLPVYSMTHAIRIIVQARTETTLTWEQLRSPQVSQFLVKPMQQQIRTQHFSPGTLYALMANCLQFEKEGQLYLGNAGISSTRARVCELLAMKLLKEYTTRELIDALSYDFYPLQGISGSQTPLAVGGRPRPAALRTSTLEVAIRASAKHFLSHPLVVQQLEAIWNGAISFCPTSEQPQCQDSAPSAVGSSQSRRQSTVRTPLLGGPQSKEDLARLQSLVPGRRSVTLYDPRSASVLKLSRLRVPRYRHILSTCSLVILIGLFLAVLGQRSSKITSLELLFWFWSAGFMLDEIVGFNEQGFSLYIMSFWNIFDLGILLLLIVYYCMRIYGVFLLDPHKWNENAYDVLAASGILLLPRIFSVLDHHRYFSQLLISFRLLAIDLIAVFILILVCCSGFFVFFTFSKNAEDPYVLAYKIFQILMGFTPAAWEVWPSYNWMGKALMGLFLIICHFAVITILITVLGNSYTSIASNAKQEHQFLFAINTISMAKKDALFSYIAPANILAWTLMPLRYFIPMKQFVWVNRVAIKATHFPLLFCIYFYEKYFLAPYMYEATDLVDKPDRGRQHGIPFADPSSRSAFFSPSIRVREESVFGCQKDRALEEVFLRAPDSAVLRTQRRNERRKTQNAIRTWMDQHDAGFNSPPNYSTQNYSTIDSRLTSDWHRRLSMNRERPSRFPRHYSDIRSAASDPADFISDAAFPTAPEMYKDGIARRDYATEVKDITDGDADGDDELVTNDEDEEDNATNNLNDEAGASGETIEEDYFTTPVATRFTNAELSSADSPRPGAARRMALHHRTLSTNTILYAPETDQQYSDSSASAWPAIAPRALSRPVSSRPTPVASPVAPRGGDSLRSPRRSLYMAARPRLTTETSGSSMARTMPSNHRTSGLSLDIPATLTTTTTTSSGSRKPPARRRSLVDFDGPSAADDAFGGAPSSLPTRTSVLSSERRHSGDSGGGNTRASRAMMAKMKSLEDSLGHMVREMRVLRMSVPNTAHNSDDGLVSGGGSGSGERTAPPQRFSVGSDPSSVGGGGARHPLPLIEIADHGHGSGGRAGGLRRSRTTPRRVPGRRTTAAAGIGYWRSPSSKEGVGSGSSAVPGLGIRGRYHGEGGEDAVMGKGKGKEVRQPPLLPRSSSSFGGGPAMSPDFEEEVGGGGGFSKGTSL